MKRPITKPSGADPEQALLQRAAEHGISEAAARAILVRLGEEGIGRDDLLPWLDEWIKAAREAFEAGVADRRLVPPIAGPGLLNDTRLSFVEIRDAFARASELGARLGQEHSDLVSPETVQDGQAGSGQDLAPSPLFAENSSYGTDLSEARRLYGEALKLGYTFESALETLREKASSAAAREMTGRAKAEPRLGYRSTADQIFAEAAAKSFRRNRRHVFTEAELRDPDAINRARDTLSDIETARNNGLKISDEQRQAGNRAKAFIRKVSQLNAA